MNLVERLYGKYIFPVYLFFKEIAKKITERKKSPEWVLGDTINGKVIKLYSKETM